MGELIVRMVFVWRIVAGKNQIWVVTVAIINDNIWFLCRPIFGDDFHVGFVIRPRVCIRLLICCGEIVVHSIEAAIISIIYIRYDVFVARLRDNVAKVEITVRIEIVHQNIPIVIIVSGRWLITLIVLVVIAIRTATRTHEHFIIVGNLQVKWMWRILMIC